MPKVKAVSRGRNEVGGKQRLQAIGTIQKKVWGKRKGEKTTIEDEKTQKLVVAD